MVKEDKKDSRKSPQLNWFAESLDKKETTTAVPALLRAKPKPAVNGGTDFPHWFWASGKAEGEEAIAKQPVTDDKSVEEEVTQMLVDNSKINAPTFVNLLKSKGMKITKESMQESKHVSLGNVTFQCRFKEAKDNTDPTRASKFRVVLIQEGLGNLKDGYYYTKQALKSAIPVFEGKKMYVDHPDRIQEATRPERSVRDIGGHFENLEYKESEDGTGMLEADLCVLPDDPFQWIRALMRHATDYSQKYPDKDFVGLSINASGDAKAMDAQEFLKQSDLPRSALPKIESAMADGLSEIKIVNNISEAVSCDLVTEAGAKGKILELLEAEKMKENKDELKKEAEEKKEAFGSKSSDDDKKDADAKDDGSDKKEDAKDGDGEDSGHDDAEQDQALIVKMLKKHGLIKGDDGDAEEAKEEEAKKEDEAKSEEAHSEEDMEADTIRAGKHYMQAYKKEGHKSEEAAHRAAEAMKCARHAQEGFKKESEGMKKEDMEAKKESATVKSIQDENMKLVGENSKLKESLNKIEVEKHIDAKLKESKLPMSVTKKFKEKSKSYKTKKEVDEKFELFMEGWRATSGEAGSLDEFVISTEKETATIKGEVSLDDCID